MKKLRLYYNSHVKDGNLKIEELVGRLRDISSTALMDRTIDEEDLSITIHADEKSLTSVLLVVISKESNEFEGRLKSIFDSLAIDMSRNPEAVNGVSEFLLFNEDIKSETPDTVMNVIRETSISTDIYHDATFICAMLSGLVGKSITPIENANTSPAKKDETGNVILEDELLEAVLLAITSKSSKVAEMLDGIKLNKDELVKSISEGFTTYIDKKFETMEKSILEKLSKVEVKPEVVIVDTDDSGNPSLVLQPETSKVMDAINSNIEKDASTFEEPKKENVLERLTGLASYEIESDSEFFEVAMENASVLTTDEKVNICAYDMFTHLTEGTETAETVSPMIKKRRMLRMSLL